MTQPILLEYLKEKDITTGTGPREVTEFKKNYCRDIVDEVNIWTSKKMAFNLKSIDIAKKYYLAGPAETA